MTSDLKLKGLVIEDDPEMAGLVQRLLRKRFSIEADIAQDCASARRMMSSTRYDIITLDFRLPDGAGLDLLDEITESGEHPPVIMVTGHGDEETAAHSFRSRAAGYVVKDSRLPFMLTDAVEKTLAETSLKSVEKDLLYEKAFIEDALNCLPDLFAVLDLEGNLFRWNRKVSETTGYSDQELASMNMMDLFRPEDARTLADGMTRMRDGETVVTEAVLETRDGDQLEIELSGRMLSGYMGKPMGFCGTARDLSERRRAEAALKRCETELEVLAEQRAAELAAVRDELDLARAELATTRDAALANEERFRSVMDNSMDIIATFDAKGFFLSSNRASEHILGYNPEEFMQRPIFELVHPDDVGKLLDAHARAQSECDIAQHLDLRFRHKDGSWHTLDCIGQSFIGPEGNLMVVVNARDVSDRKEYQEQLERLNRELEGYARTVSHDLRSPLTAIKLAGDTLSRLWEKRDGVDDIGSEIRRIGEVISISAAQAESLIKDLLDLAIAGQEPDEVVEVDVGETVARILEERINAIAEKGIEVKLDADLGRVAASPTHVYQLFGNLIDNAVRYNDSLSPRITVRYLGADENLGHGYSVEDNGPGVPEENARDVFLPFFKGEGGDTGIGLAIVEKIVSLYGGSISVEGDDGARFSFFIKDR
jgi:PAS domain S-box-containing protein